MVPRYFALRLSLFRGFSEISRTKVRRKEKRGSFTANRPTVNRERIASVLFRSQSPSDSISVKRLTSLQIRQHPQILSCQIRKSSHVSQARRDSSSSRPALSGAAVTSTEKGKSSFSRGNFLGRLNASLHSISIESN